jgi:CRP-like cAMP-binding protein
LGEADEASLTGLSIRTRNLQPGEDFTREGDEPNLSAIVLEGWVARYHSLRGGGRQYLSLHLPGDWPDAQGLLLKRIDHSICAIGPAVVGTIRHDQLRSLFQRSAPVAEALWRETLIDAAIFRQAITNNGSRSATKRMAHLFCELFYRARQAGLTEGEALTLPLNQFQLGDVLGLALVTVNRTVRSLRATASVDFRNGRLIIVSWDTLADIAEFDPGYLNV